MKKVNTMSVTKCYVVITCIILSSVNIFFFYYEPFLLRGRKIFALKGLYIKSTMKSSCILKNMFFFSIESEVCSIRNIKKTKLK